VRAARDAAFSRAVELVAEGDGVVVDVATGRGTLLERLLETGRPLVATDVSPTVLRRVEQRFGDARISYVATDARSLPFADAEIPTLTTYVGLGNVPDTEALLRELRRVGRELGAVHQFYRDDGSENAEAIRAGGFAGALFRNELLASAERAGWTVEIEAERTVVASPTPDSLLVPGLRVDGIPVAETEATWCVLHGR
jgi:ubiquinone/menaquinone biosynthesis C-methylase UbiE